MILTIVVFALVLGILVFAHELGHFFTARKFGVKAEEFGFGLPPRMFGWKKKNGKWKWFWGTTPTDKLESEDTILSLNWLPLGGFVQIKGEEGENTDPDSFAVQKAWKRAIILVAGVTMNVILAAVLLALTFMIGSPQSIDPAKIANYPDAHVQISRVFKDTPADKAGIKPGDVVLMIDGQSMVGSAAVQDYLKAKKDTEVTINIDRYGQKQEIKVTPTVDESIGYAAIGVGLSDVAVVKYPWYRAIYEGGKASVLLTGRIVKAFYFIIHDAILGKEVGVDFAGPVGIAVMTGQAARMGWSYILQFTALLSINLAIINILPLPALDGGRLLFIAIEKVRRRPVSKKVENIIHSIGFLILIGLMLFITGRDIFRFDTLVNKFF